MKKYHLPRYLVVSEKNDARRVSYASVDLSNPSSPTSSPLQTLRDRLPLHTICTYTYIYSWLVPFREVNRKNVISDLHLLSIRFVAGSAQAVLFIIPVNIRGHVGLTKPFTLYVGLTCTAVSSRETVRCDGLETLEVDR